MTTTLPSAEQRVAPNPSGAVALTVGDYPALITRVRKQVTRDEQAWTEARAEGREPYPYFRVWFHIDGDDQGAKTMQRNFSLSPQAWPITSGLLTAAFGLTHEELAEVERIDEQEMVGETVGVHLEMSFSSRIPDNYLQAVFPVDEVQENQPGGGEDNLDLTT